jgi:VanZ family protein
MQLILYANRLYKFFEKYFSRHIGLILATYWIVLFILTSIPSNALPSIGTSDKIKHFGAYFVLTLLVRFYAHFRRKFFFSSKQQITLIAILVLVYGIFDEIHQYFIPGRFFDLLDLLANFLGIIAASLFSSYIINSNHEKSG